MIFVRGLTAEEGDRLLRIIRGGQSVVTVRRAEIVLASAQGMRALQIAQLYHCSVDHVRDVIHRFNADGTGLGEQGGTGQLVEGMTV